MIITKCFLHRVERVAVGKALNGHHIRTLTLDRKYAARLNGLSVDMNYTGAALTCITTNVGACQAQMVSKILDKQGPRLYLSRD